MKNFYVPPRCGVRRPAAYRPAAYRPAAYRPAAYRPAAYRPAAYRPERGGLVFLAPGGSGEIVSRRCSVFDLVLARWLGFGLDRQLAAGRVPESGRLLAARAAELVAMDHRRALARDWEHLVDLARRGPGPGAGRRLLRRGRALAAEAEIREMVAHLLSPVPVAARGVAAARMLLTDGTGPLHHEHHDVGLREALTAVTAQLDPWISLFPPPALPPSVTK